MMRHEHVSAGTKNMERHAHPIMNLTRTPLMVLRVACLGCFVASAFGAEQVSQKIDAAPDGRVIVSNTAGSITVTGWGENAVEVTGELGDDVRELVFERDGNEVVVRVETGSRSGRRVSSDLELRIPRESSLRASGVSADIEVRGVRGELRLNSVSGDISAQVFGSVEAATVSGDIDLAGEGAEGYARLSSVSGDVDVKGLSGELEMTSVSGDLAVDGGTWSRFYGQTTSGDMDWSAAVTDNARVDVETINGDLEVIFRGELSARFDIETFNGHIRNCFGPEPQRTSRYAPGRELRFSEGDGGARVTIKTLNGDLRLCRD